MKAQTFLDLFCGCGGFTLGMIRSGMRCLAALDVDPAAVATLRDNNIRAWVFLAQTQGVPICLHTEEQTEILAREARIKRHARPSREQGACKTGLARCHGVGM